MTNKEKCESIKASIITEVVKGKATQYKVLAKQKKGVVECDQMVQTMSDLLENMAKMFFIAAGRQITDDDRQTINKSIQTYKDGGAQLSKCYVEKIAKLDIKLLDDIMDVYEIAAQKMCDVAFKD